MIKITFPYVGDTIGGSHFSSLNIYKILKESRIYDSDIILHKDDDKLSKYLTDNKIPFKIFKINKFVGEDTKVFKNIFFILINTLKIFKYIKKNNIDIVHGNDLRINLSWIVATFLSRKIFIWHQRVAISNSLFWFFFMLFPKKIIVPSNFIYNQIPKIFKRKTKILKNIIFDRNQLNLIDLNINESIYNYNFGYVGKISKNKNIIKLLHLFNLLSKKIKKKITLNIAGNLDENFSNEFYEFINKNNIKNIIIFKFSDNISFITKNDFIISPGLNESFGRTLLESMYLGKICIASNSGAHKELITNSKNGFLVNFDNPKNFIELFEKFLNNKDLLIKMKISSSNYAKDNFNLNVISSDYIKFYNKLSLK
tara:strand:+ start:11046 stop:12152 length:1107 start_codon:yes stop_codon:yes gene_type:complete